jgi:LCP family protein required for cell wall assembly
MSQQSQSRRWYSLACLATVASLVLTSCSSGLFAGERGVRQAAQEVAPKPELQIGRSSSPLPALGAEDYRPPVPPVRPFSVSRALFPTVATADDVPSAMLMAAPGAPATPYPAPVGPAFNWSQTDNYLVLGTDHRPGWTNWRTDTVIVVGVDRANGRVAVFTIPRDMYVQIPGYGWGRINQVDYIGEQVEAGNGPRLVSQVLENALGIATNHFVRVRMDGFIDFVNAVGGVTVHLDCPFYEPIFNLDTNAWDYFALPAGDVWMDGDTAYWFVRLRYRESDIGRGQRQRTVLWALRDQVSKTNLLARFPEIFAAFQNMFSTDLNPLQILDLLNWGMGLDAGAVRAGGLTLYDLQSYTTPEGASVLRIADPGRVRNVVENVWSAPAMADSYRKDATSCPPLPAGVTYNTEAANVPDLSNIDPDAQTPPPPAEGIPPAEAPAEATQVADAPTEATQPAEPPADAGQPTEPPATEAAPAEPPPAGEVAQPAEPAPPAAEPDPGSLLPTPTPAPISFSLPTPTPAPVSLAGPPAAPDDGG